jgi:hypothetical protein
LAQGVPVCFDPLDFVSDCFNGNSQLLQGCYSMGRYFCVVCPFIGYYGFFHLEKNSGLSFSIPCFSLPDSLFDRVLLILFIGILGLTGFLAWKVPPQTYDALTYHLSRVAHWAQLHAVRHFATGIERQIVNQPGAEIIQLHFYLLANGDRLANFIEWSAMLCSLIGVSLIAKQFGAQPSSQWISAVFAATLSMGLVQASSTMTDYVISFWMV